MLEFVFVSYLESSGSIPELPTPSLPEIEKARQEGAARFRALMQDRLGNSFAIVKGYAEAMENADPDKIQIFAKKIVQGAQAFQANYDFLHHIPLRELAEPEGEAITVAEEIVVRLRNSQPDITGS